LLYPFFPPLIARSRLTIPGTPEGKVAYGDPVYGITKLSWPSPDRSYVSVRNPPKSVGFELEG